MQYFTLKVIELRQETDDTVTIVFKQPALKKVRYLPGQYLSLIFRINGRQYIRPYSFSSAPVVDENLAVTVKRVPGGVVSNHIIDTIKPTDVVQAIEPHGDFTLNKDFISQDSNLVLWGSGSGITPLMSIIKYSLRHDLCKHVTLVYGNRHMETVIFREAIIQLEKEYPDKFNVLHFHTRLTVNPVNTNTVMGRIDPAKVMSILGGMHDLSNTVHYICGPTGLKESIKSVLAKLDIDASRIMSEDFEIVRDPKEFHDVITTNVRVTVGGFQHTIEVAKGKSVLEAGLDALIDFPYSCQTGNCAICKGNLIKGELKSIGVEDKDLSHLSQGEHLLCCSFPLTDNIEIQID